MGKFFNRAAHFGIGFGVGLWAHRPSALVATTAFVAYQRTEQMAIHDAAYPEIREFGYGMALGLATREAYRFLRERGHLRRLCGRLAAARADQPDADTGVR